MICTEWEFADQAPGMVSYTSVQAVFQPPRAVNKTIQDPEPIIKTVCKDKII